MSSGIYGIFGRREGQDFLLYVGLTRRTFDLRAQEHAANIWTSDSRKYQILRNLMMEGVNVYFGVLYEWDPFEGEQDMDMLETEMIRKYNPPLNVLGRCDDMNWMNEIEVFNRDAWNEEEAKSVLTLERPV
jgi:hypothetical protein